MARCNLGAHRPGRLWRRAHCPGCTGVGIIGLEADGFGEILERTVQVAFVVAHNASVVVGEGVIGLEADGRGVTANFFVQGWSL